MSTESKVSRLIVQQGCQHFIYVHCINNLLNEFSTVSIFLSWVHCLENFIPCVAKKLNAYAGKDLHRFLFLHTADTWVLSDRSWYRWPKFCKPLQCKRVQLGYLGIEATQRKFQIKTMLFQSTMSNENSWNSEKSGLITKSYFFVSLNLNLIFERSLPALFNVAKAKRSWQCWKLIDN